ncbi:MAG: tRNA dimethylallyltransferase [Dehalococcoidia bacterium]|nr:MAG: tRNA dimethylallyltransferase [Dehalococcoidia bacterium]
MGAELLVPLVAIVGPTGTGKTALAIALAERLDGEIINADSRQVYRGMDIGTAKPTAEQRARVPHHLFDLVEPNEPFTLSDYLTLVRQEIPAIAARGRLPFLVGGSGLYVRAVLEGLRPPPVPPDPQLRQQLSQRAEREGTAALVAELTARDPVGAARIDPRNIRRLVRALEVVLTTGQPFSALGQRCPPPYRTLRIGLTLERAALYRRLDARTEAMLAAGWVEEVRRLRERGFGPELPALSGHGYRELLAYLDGQLSLEAARQRIAQLTHRYVRQQYTWFRLDDPGIVWFDASRADLVEAVADRIVRWRRACTSPRCTEPETTSSWSTPPL